ncbi:MAG: DUF6377 domain-containing protein [Prevotellaceae bacterium]|jgi:hypothetical protein|nr:DUF6377 domain-containing protein [Prevotellaceae bacterium]
MKSFFIGILLFVSAACCFAADNLGALLNQLDQTIAQRQTYTDIREHRILELKQMLKTPNISDGQTYELNTRLYSEYKTYNCDSAFYHAENALRIAELLGKEHFINEAKLNKISVFNVIGMYKEALDLLQSINKNVLSNELKIKYFNIQKEVYSNYSNNNVYAVEYKKISDNYRDSLLNLLDKNSEHYLIVYSEKLLEAGRVDEASEILFGLLKAVEPENHLFAVLTYGIADVFLAKGDKEKAKIYCAKSAAADLKNAIKENASMQALALLLYESGDLKHAYKYIKYSLEDAVFCNARLRTFEISRIFPIIDDAYQEKTQKQKKQLTFYLVLTAILSFFLIIAVAYVYKQMKKLSKARKELSNINLQLNGLNSQLQNYNKELSEANHIKEEYIGHFLDLCSAYIDKLEDYRKTLHRKAADSKIDELFKMLKSTEMVDKEVTELYQNFDKIFLSLFPTFIEDFNTLMLPEEHFVRKQGELLSVEMRICALIRLGITDSSKIAKFLRYSSNTIYNYRAKIKTKASVPREDFEKTIMKIGSFGK